MLKECEACDAVFETQRKDRRYCTLECKRELKRRYDKARYAEIAGDTIARACQWQRDNRQRKAEYDAAYREVNAEKIRARTAGRTKPLEVGRVDAAKRRARKRHNGAYSVTVRDMRRLYNRAHYSCAYCQEPLPWGDIEWDHIVPISRGGAHSIGNLAPACNRCNRSKAWKLLTEWRAGRIVSQYTMTARVNVELAA